MRNSNKKSLIFIGITAVLMAVTLLACPSPTSNNDTTAPSLAATQDGIQDGDTEFQIRFTEAVQKVSGQTLAEGITVAVNGASPTAVSSASINSDTRYVDIGLPTVKDGDKVDIVIKQGFLQDAAGNKNNQLTMPTITVSAASSDNTPPALAPVQEDLVSGSRSYTLTFTEDLVMAVDTEVDLAAGIKKVVGGTEYTATAAFIDPNDSTKVVIAFSNEFNQGESVTFKIEANLLKDSSDNKNEAIESSPVSVADKAPELEGLQAELINGDNDYTIKFDEELTLTSGVTDLTTKIQIAVNSGTAENVDTAAIDGTDKSLVAISWTTPVNTDDVVRITIAAGAFQDSGGNANLEMSIDKTVAATGDETPPAVATTQTIEAGSSTSTVVFTEPVKAVEGANLEAGISLTPQGDGPINAQYVEIDSAARTQVTISFASVLNYPGQMLDLDIDADLFQDASGNKNLALTLSVEVLDTTPPALDPEQADLEAGSTAYSIEFSEGLSLVSGADLAAGIKVSINGTEEAVNSAAIGTSEVDITLASSADFGDTVSLSVAAGLLKDYFDNQNAAASVSLTVVDTTGPVLASAQANLEAHSTEYTIEFTESVELVTTASDLAAGITLSIDGTDASPLAASIDDTDQKLVRLTLGAQAGQTVTFAMAADLLKDTHNNHNEVISATSITVTDSTGPKLQPVQAGILDGENAYTIRFNENLVLGDGVTDLASKIQVSVNGTSTAASNASINGTTVDITFAPVTTDQTVDITIEADALKDAAGNHNAALSVPTITVTAAGDITKPGLATTQNDLTVGSSSYTITLNEPVALVGSNLAAGITFTINGDSLTVQSALIDSQDPRLVKVLLTTAASYRDTVSFTIAADKLKDAAGNQNILLTSGNLTIADGTGPALAPLQDHFEAGTTSYSIKFTEPLTLVSTEDALAARTKVSINGASETAVQSAGINTGDTKNVDITLASPLSLGDTISFTMEAGLLKDAADNQNGAIPATSIDVRDTIPPAVAAVQDDLVAGSVQYTIRFTEPVFEVDSAKTKAEIFFQIGRPTGVADIIDGVIEAVKDVRIDDDDPTLVHVTLSETASVDPDGTADTVKRSLHPSAFKDAAGNENAGLYPHSDDYRPIIVADQTPPALAADQDDFVSGSTTYTLKFTEHVSEVSGATLADGVHFSDGQNTLNVSNADVNSTDPTRVDITFESAVTVEDSLTFTMDAGVLEDKAGNGNAAIPSTSIEVVDTTGPALAGTPAELEAGTTSYTVTFNEEVFPAGTAKQLADGIKFTIGGTEKSSTAAVIDSVNPESVRITLASAAAFGDGVSLKIAAGLLKDSKGNLNEEITISSVSVSDTIGPKLRPVQAELVNGATYTIAFNEDLVLGDGVTLASEIQVGSTNAQTASIDGTDASLVKITFTAVPVGTVDITIAAGALKDGQDNHISALTLSGITVSASADTVPPAPAAAQASLEAGSTSYSIKFTEPVALVGTEADLATGLKFTIGGGSAASVSAARVDADDPSIVHVTLASAAASGDSASFTIDADLLKDAAGNTNEATQQAIQLTIVDTTGPALAGEQEKLEARGTEYRITFTEPVSLVSTEAALAAGITISIDGTDVEVTAASIDAADGKYVDITLASGANLGSNVNLSVLENLLKDAANNQNAATPTIGITVADNSGPKLLPAQDQDDIAELDRYYKLRFDENLKLKAGADLTAGILIDVGTRLTNIGAKNPAIDEDDPTIVHIELPTVIEGENVTISIEADLFTDAHDNPNNGGQNFTKTIQAQVPGVVRTLAGQLRVRDNVDNLNGAEAALGKVLALIVDGNKIYAADKTNKSIRMIDEFGAVSTIIGSGLNDPSGLALYGTDLYVSDRGIRQILKFNLSDPANIPTADVVAGDGTTGRVDGIGISASFNDPKTLAINGNGDTLYVIDLHHIREINLKTKEVTTIAGGGNASHGNGLDTAFYFPNHLTIDSAGKYLYVADTYHHQIKRIDLESADKTVTIVAGSGVQGYFNAYGTNAEFSYPFGICLDAAEEYLFVVDQNDLIRRITLSNSKVEYLAGVRYKDFQTATGEGSLSEMEFGRAKKLTVGSGNFLYVGDELLFTVMKLYLP